MLHISFYLPRVLNILIKVLLIDVMVPEETDLLLIAVMIAARSSPLIVDMMLSTLFVLINPFEPAIVPAVKSLYVAELFALPLMVAPYVANDMTFINVVGLVKSTFPDDLYWEYKAANDDPKPLPEVYAVDVLELGVDGDVNCFMVHDDAIIVANKRMTIGCFTFITMV